MSRARRSSMLPESRRPLLRGLSLPFAWTIVRFAVHWGVFLVHKFGQGLAIQAIARDFELAEHFQAAFHLHFPIEALDATVHCVAGVGQCTGDLLFAIGL